MENNNTHPDENDTRTFAYCPCCGRHVEMPSRDEDHAEWCANRNGYTDDVVETMAREWERRERADYIDRTMGPTEDDVASEQAEMEQHKLHAEASYSHDARAKLGYV